MQILWTYVSKLGEHQEYDHIGFWIEHQQHCAIGKTGLFGGRIFPRSSGAGHSEGKPQHMSPAGHFERSKQGRARLHGSSTEISPKPSRCVTASVARWYPALARRVAAKPNLAPIVEKNMIPGPGLNASGSKNISSVAAETSTCGPPVVYPGCLWSALQVRHPFCARA